MPFSSQDGHCMTLPKYMVYLNHPHTAKTLWKKYLEEIDFYKRELKREFNQPQEQWGKKKVLYFKFVFL